MTPDELLRRYPRETLRWLRGRLGLSQPGLGTHVGVVPQTVAAWEARRRAIGPVSRARLTSLLAPYLATSQGAAFVRALDDTGTGGAGSDADLGEAASPTTRAGLRRVWHAGGKGWEDVPAEHRGRNLAIARAYLETAAPIRAIAARHGVSRMRVPAVARTVVYHILGRRPPTR